MNAQNHKKLIEYLGEFGGGFFISFYTILMCWIYARYDILGKLSINGSFAVGITLVAITFGVTYIPVLYTLLLVFSKTKCYCHFNPAVSVAFRHAKGLNNKDIIWYIAAQTVGGILAGLLLYIIVSSIDGNKSSWANPDGYYMGATCTKSWESHNLWGFNINDIYTLILLKIFLGFLIEAVGFCAFMLLIFNVNKMSHNKHVINLILGGGLALVVAIEIPFTGGSLNAVRSIGPVLFGSWGHNQGGQLWIDYIQSVTGPICGGILASYINHYLNKKFAAFVL